MKASYGDLQIELTQPWGSQVQLEFAGAGADLTSDRRRQTADPAVSRLPQLQRGRWWSDPGDLTLGGAACGPGRWTEGQPTRE